MAKYIVSGESYDILVQIPLKFVRKAQMNNKLKLTRINY